jgi:hypothetical protein
VRGETIMIAGRFCGPDGSANGGYAAGTIAQRLGGTVEVTLRVPPPLDRPLRIEHDGDVRVWDGETLVAEARPTTVDLEPPPPLSFADAEDAALPAGDPASPFPNCFVCGRSRLPGDGLRIFAGRVPGSELVAAPWVPDESLCRMEFVWAALDCPGAYACDASGRGEALLGRLSARVERLPRPGERCVVVGQSLGEMGRRLFAGTYLFGADGDLVGLAQAIWIVPLRRG